MTIILIILIIAAVTIFLFLWWLFSYLWDKKEGKIQSGKLEFVVKGVSSIVLVLTVFSIGFNTTTFLLENNKRERIGKENKEAYKEVSSLQLQKNREYALDLQKNIKNYLETTSIPMDRFYSSDLEKILNLPLSRETRIKIIRYIAYSEIGNRLLDMMQNPSDPQQKSNWLSDLNGKILPPIIDDSESLIQEIGRQKVD